MHGRIRLVLTKQNECDDKDGCDVMRTRVGPSLYQPEWVAACSAIKAKALQDKGMPAANVIGFIDGTRFRVAMPK